MCMPFVQREFSRSPATSCPYPVLINSAPKNSGTPRKRLRCGQERVFNLLLDTFKINDEIVENMREWKHSGFSVDISVRIDKDDHAGMQRLIEYVSRCPFSLAQMVSRTDDGRIIYRTTHPNCLPFPLSGDSRTHIRHRVLQKSGRLNSVNNFL